ncbi:MAG: AzlD domain-containing protein [Eggerthellaceae bacterium]|nr:AzlD domain-containing protein [Eggerthellaceae bacterium]
MSWIDFWIIFGCCALTMLACRTLPLFLLKGKELPENLNRALGFIPPAAFAALVANDLLAPGMFDAGLWPAAIPFIAAACVIAVALKTKSLLWSALTGVAAFALLLLI